MKFTIYFLEIMFDNFAKKVGNAAFLSDGSQRIIEEKSFKKIAC